MAVKLHNEAKTSKAEQVYREILQEQPNNAHALHYLGLILADYGQLDQAEKNLKQSLSLKPDFAVFNHNIAGFFSRMGNVDSAITHFTRAIELKPDYVEAYQGLSECTKLSKSSKVFSLLLEQINNPALSLSEKRFLEFAAGKIEADSGNYDTAFQHYQLGNHYKQANFDVKGYINQIEQIKEIFSVDFLSDRNDWGLNSQQPIFILGMPRSGTSLLEQVLSSHSQVYGAGEINDITSIINVIVRRLQKPYPDCLTDVCYTDVVGFALEYKQRLDQTSGNARFVINKSPLNFKYLGFILMMFPNAKIIHAERDPVDTCLSCFFQNFTKGQQYSFDLEHLGHFYNGYDSLMKHWNQLFGGRILNASYEAIISDSETSIRDLTEFCGLEWEQACLSPQNTIRPVATASKYQVRQPLYSSSVKKWKRYEKHLQPLLKVLNAN